MTEDGDEPTTALLIGSAVAAVGGLATTGVALAQGGPNLPDVPKPPPPPKPPPAPAPLPPQATEQGLDPEKRKRASRFSVSDTLLTNPLGGGGTPGTMSKSLLGGG
jgi:hypothetical protein